MSLRHLKIFVAVCRAGSITGAAKALYMTQPAVSLAIRELEAGYGVTLFDRMSRRIRITADGERLLEYAQHIVELFDNMEAEMKNPDSGGKLRIGSSKTIGACLLPLYLKEFSVQHPAIRVHVTVDNSCGILEAIKSGQLDLGLVEGFVPQDTLTAIPFQADSLAVVASPSSPFASRASITLSDLLASPLLLREQGSGVRELFESVVRAAGQSVTPLWESVSTTALLRAAEANIGLSVLPCRLVQEAVKEGRVVLLPVRGISLRRSFSLVHHKKKFLSDSLLSFMSIVKAGAASEKV